MMATNDKELHCSDDARESAKGNIENNLINNTQMQLIAPEKTETKEMDQRLSLSSEEGCKSLHEDSAGALENKEDGDALVADDVGKSSNYNCEAVIDGNAEIIANKEFVNTSMDKKSSNELQKVEMHLINLDKTVPSVAQIRINKPLCADYGTSSSDAESDSDSDSDSDTDSDSSSSTLSHSDSESESSESSSKLNNEESRKSKIKNSLTTDLSLSDLPPIENLKISVAEDECQEIGVISSIVDTLVVVESFKGAPALDMDTVLFLDKGHNTLGKVFDVLGPVTEPVYTVRFNTSLEIAERNIEKGFKVYCAPKTEYTNFVFVAELMKMRGSDASWKNNEEAPPEFQDFSDDEEEHKFRTKARNQTGSSAALKPAENRKKIKVSHPKFNPRNPVSSPRFRFPPAPFASDANRPPVHHSRFYGNPFCGPFQAPYPYRQRHPYYHSPGETAGYCQPYNFPQRYSYPQFPYPPPVTPPFFSGAPPPPPPPQMLHQSRPGENFSPRPSGRVFGSDIERPSE